MSAKYEFAAGGGFVGFLCENKAIKTYCLDAGFCLYLRQIAKLLKNVGKLEFPVHYNPFPRRVQLEINFSVTHSNSFGLESMQ